MPGRLLLCLIISDLALSPIPEFYWGLSRDTLCLYDGFRRSRTSVRTITSDSLFITV